LDSISCTIALLCLPYFLLSAYNIAKFINSPKNELEGIFSRYGSVTDDLKFVSRNAFSHLQRLDRMQSNNNKTKFNKKKQFLINNYHLISYSKKFITTVIIFALNDQPILQISFLIAINVFYFAFLCWI
jgi:hypothetical protein